MVAIVEVQSRQSPVLIVYFYSKCIGRGAHFILSMVIILRERALLSKRSALLKVAVANLNASTDIHISLQRGRDTVWGGAFV
jgi:hypothetical protein